MQICVSVEAGRLRRWHLQLLQTLAARPGVRVHATLDESRPAGGAIDALLWFERRLFGLSPESLADRLTPSALAAFAAGGCDGSGEFPGLVIDLTSHPSPKAWRLAYDGRFGEDALIAAIVERRTPEVALIGPAGVLATARPGAEQPGLARENFGDICARLTTLLIAEHDGRAVPGLPALPERSPDIAPAARLTAARAAGLGAARLKQWTLRELYRLACHSPHWRVGWRRRGDQDLIDLRRHPEPGWNDLGDDGRRFYADPFPLLRQGKVTLFVEEFEHRVGKGIISAVEFDQAGPVGAPFPVLELPHHLSYPNVFERDGEVWMVPEGCASGGVDLYRATAFPGGWTHEARLLDNVVASDATLFERGGVWWMFATMRDAGGSFSDALCLWRAPSYRGPWKAHPRNPVLIDIASARSAGRMVERGGALYRPVQDCRQGYGAALGIARVDRLDDEGYAQTVETILHAGPGWPGRRLHTLNAAGPFEFIDGSALAPRWVALRGAGSPGRAAARRPGVAAATPG